MSVDLSEFQKLGQPKKKKCPIGSALEVLDKTEREQLVAALAADSRVINAGAIVKWLEKRSHELNAQYVVSHRRGTCTCHG